MSLTSAVNAAMTSTPSVSTEEVLEMEAARRESSLRLSEQRKTARKVQKSFFRAPLEFGEQCRPDRVTLRTERGGRRRHPLL